MDGTEIMGKRVQVSKSTNVSYDIFYGFLSDFRMVPVVVAVEAAVAHAVEVLQDAVVANGHTEHNTLLLLKTFPAVASMSSYHPRPPNPNSF